MNLIGLVRHYLRALETRTGGLMQDEIKRYLREEQKALEKAKKDVERRENNCGLLSEVLEYVENRGRQQGPRATAKPQESQQEQ